MVFSTVVHASQSKPAQHQEIVAKIGNVVIAGNDFTEQVEIEKNKWERIGVLQSETFYEKAALRQLVLNKLLENDAKGKGIVITDKEASNYLNNIVNTINKLKENDPSSIQFYNDVKASGYDTVEDYVNSPFVIESTKNVLMRAQVKKQIFSTVSLPTDEEVDSYIIKNNLDVNNPEQRAIMKYQIYQNNIIKKWDRYIDDLIDKGDYELFVNIDIKGFKYPEIEFNKSQFYQGNIKQ